MNTSTLERTVLPPVGRPMRPAVVRPVGRHHGHLLLRTVALERHGPNSGAGGCGSKARRSATKKR
jgi:hypothetical protein